MYFPHLYICSLLVYKYSVYYHFSKFILSLPLGLNALYSNEKDCMWHKPHIYYVPVPPLSLLVYTYYLLYRDRVGAYNLTPYGTEIEENLDWDPHYIITFSWGHNTLQSWYQDWWRLQKLQTAFCKYQLFPLLTVY